MSEPGTWRIEGSYYETCNCFALCPCRRLDGKPGGKSTFRTCQFLLSWHVERGFAGDVDLAGINVAMAGFYDNDVRGKPWTIVLYIDERVGEPAFDAVTAIFCGKRGGNILFTANIADVLAVRRADLMFDHTKDGERIVVRDFASAEAERNIGLDGRVTCSIPGHDHPGAESVARARVEDGVLNWAYEGRCGFATDFDYHS